MKNCGLKKINDTVQELKIIHSGKKIRLIFQNEAGFGRINKPKYCWCEAGIRPSVPCHHIREYRYAYGAVEPLSGEGYFLVMPYCNTACMNIFFGKKSENAVFAMRFLQPWKKSLTAYAIPFALCPTLLRHSITSTLNSLAWAVISFGLRHKKYSFSGENEQKIKLQMPFGGDKRDRTADLLNAIQALSQLSYTPV